MDRFKKRLALFLLVLAATFTVSVVNIEDVQAASKKIRLNYSKITMTEGYKMKLKVKGTSKKVKWKSTNKKVATVNKKGKVVGKNSGKCTVTAKVKGKKLKCKIVIKEVKNNKAKVVEKFTEPTLNVSEVKIDISSAFKLEMLNVKSSDKVAWMTSNAAVSFVKDGNVTAVAEGTCVITAKVNGVSYRCNVTVTDLNDADEISKQNDIYEMLSLINKDRVKANVAPLKLKDDVNKVANIRAKEIATVFEHSRPNRLSYTTAYASAGVKQGSIVGENIGYIRDKIEYKDTFVKDIYSSLYASPKHRENILNPEYEYIGISCFSNVVEEKGHTYIEEYWAQEFYTK